MSTDPAIWLWKVGFFEIGMFHILEINIGVVFTRKSSKAAPLPGFFSMVNTWHNQRLTLVDWDCCFACSFCCWFAMFSTESCAQGGLCWTCFSSLCVTTWREGGPCAMPFKTAGVDCKMAESYRKLSKNDTNFKIKWVSPWAFKFHSESIKW